MFLYILNILKLHAYLCIFHLYQTCRKNNIKISVSPKIKSMDFPDRVIKQALFFSLWGPASGPFQGPKNSRITTFVAVVTPSPTLRPTSILGKYKWEITSINTNSRNSNKVYIGRLFFFSKKKIPLWTKTFQISFIPDVVSREKSRNKNQRRLDLRPIRQIPWASS